MKQAEVVYTDAKVSITIITSCPTTSTKLCPSASATRCVFLVARSIQLLLSLTIAAIDTYILARVFHSPTGMALKGTLFLTILIVALTLPHTATDMYRRYYRKPSLYSAGAAVLMEAHYFFSFIILLVCVGMVHIKVIGDLCEPGRALMWVVERPNEICELLKAGIMLLSVATFFWVPTLKLVYESVRGCPRRSVQVGAIV